MNPNPAIAICIVVAANWVAGCQCRRSQDAPTGEASASAMPSTSAVPVGIPVDAELVRAAVNPRGEPPYRGPTGSVRGVVTIAGDLAPEIPGAMQKARGKCPDSALEFHGKLFREGPGRTLADAMVAVTGYDGYVPAATDVVSIRIQDCTFGTRTIAMTFGQRLDVVNEGRQGHLPRLVGGGDKAIFVVIPGGDPVSLYPNRPGRYVLTDEMVPFMNADVLVVKYPTIAVTGLDGQFEIGGIPAGEVTVNALLPATVQSVEQKVTVRERQTTEVNLTIGFDSAQHAPKPPPPASSVDPVIH